VGKSRGDNSGFFSASLLALSLLLPGLALPQGMSHTWAQEYPTKVSIEVDFTQLERVPAPTSCKRMEKAYQPVFTHIEKFRQHNGLNDKNQTLWVDFGLLNGKLWNTGYCTALPILLTERGQAVVKRFPKEIPVGGYIVGWDTVRKMPVWDSPGNDIDEVAGLLTYYYDKKNDVYHNVMYAFTNNRSPQSTFSAGKQLLEIHYRNLLDDLALLFKAGQRDNPNDPAAALLAGRGDKLLVLQILQLQEFLIEQHQGTAFLEAEHKRRGELMKVLDGIEMDSLDYDNWLLPDWCDSGYSYDNFWRPCKK
jgi:hypothetical protein